MTKILDFGSYKNVFYKIYKFRNFAPPCHNIFKKFFYIKLRILVQLEITKLIKLNSFIKIANFKNNKVVISYMNKLLYVMIMCIDVQGPDSTSHTFCFYSNE